MGSDAVNTCTCKRSDNRVDTSGMLAPPPATATPARFARAIPLRSDIFSDSGREPVERSRDELLELGAGQPEIRGRTGRDGADRGRRQLFLGPPAFGEQPDHRTRSRGRGGDCAGGRVLTAGAHVFGDDLIDNFAGEVGVADGLADLPEIRPGIGQGDSVPPAPKSHRAMEPLFGNPGLV